MRAAGGVRHILLDNGKSILLLRTRGGASSAAVLSPGTRAFSVLGRAHVDWHMASQLPARTRLYCVHRPADSVSVPWIELARTYRGYRSVHAGCAQLV